MSNGNTEHDPGVRDMGATRRRRELRAFLVAAADTARASREHMAITEYVTRPLGRMARNRVGTLLSAVG